MSLFGSPRTAILASAMMPGAGQFLQRRRIAGTVYALLFLALFLLVIVRILRMMLANLAAVNAFAGGEANQPFVQLSLWSILVPLAAAMAVFVAGLIDTYLASQRRRREPMPPSRKMEELR